MSLDLWLAFVAASAALLLSPGRTVLRVLGDAASQGRRVALEAAARVALLPPFAVLIATFASLAAVSALACALPAGRLGTRIRRPSVRLWLSRSEGAALMGTGIVIAALRRI